MIVTAPKSKYDSKIYNKIATTPPCTMTQFVATSKVTKDDFRCMGDSDNIA